MIDLIVPHKGRHIDPNVRVEVYRNLTKKDGVWYSVRQNGKVVGHTKWIFLEDCYFRVSEASRQRVIRTGHKNVHAFVVGFATTKPFRKSGLGPALLGRYNPREMERFNVFERGEWKPITCALQAELNSNGLTIWSPRA